MMRLNRTCFLWLTLLSLILGGGCSSVYFNAMERLGYAKRDLMVSRIKAARETQDQAKEQFRSALERFKSVVAVKGGNLETKYEELKRELERSEAKAKEVHNRIAAIEDVSDALFREWESELKQYKNPNLRRASERKLDETRDRYEQLIAAMKKAESKIDPVLQPLRDNVLFLKHNLNAKAIASLEGELDNVEVSVGTLVADLESAVSEADRFIAQMNKEE